MAQYEHPGLWTRELNNFADTRNGLVVPRSRSGLKLTDRRQGAEVPEANAGNISYQLALLLELPVDKSQPPFDFVCSSSSRDGDEVGQGGFDRVCALRGGVVHILTFFHDAGDAEGANAPSSISLELGQPAERAVWNAHASCVVVGDRSGRLHFIAADGTVLFSQQVAKPFPSSKSGETSQVFHCIKFASRGKDGGAASGASADANHGRAPPGQHRGEELLAVTTSLQIIHFANVPFASLEAACFAQDTEAMKQLRAGISVAVADASSKEDGQNLVERGAEACVQTMRGESRVYLVSHGGISVWRRMLPENGARRRDSSKSSKAGEHQRQTEVGSSGEQRGNTSGGVVGKLEKVDEVFSGTLFGGGGATSAELSIDGRWLVVSDDRGGLSWWMTPSVLRLARWTWPTETFRVVDMVILAGSGNHAGPANITRSLSSGNAVSAGGSGISRSASVEGESRPCVACISAAGEVRVLRLGSAGLEQLYSARGVVGPAMLTVPSALRHQFMLVSTDPVSGKTSFLLGKEAIPRHRLQALLGRGEFDRALELARAHSMDETDVHVAHLLSMLREAGATPSTVENGRNEDGEETAILSERFYAEVKSLLERLDTAGAVGKACVAAVGAPLPSLEDVRTLLEIVETRLRTFGNAGTSIRLMMLERMAAVLARLRTFELIEGGSGAVDISSDGSGSSFVDNADVSGIDDVSTASLPPTRAGEGLSQQKGSRFGTGAATVETDEVSFNVDDVLAELDEKSGEHDKDVDEEVIYDDVQAICEGPHHDPDANISEEGNAALAKMEDEAAAAVKEQAMIHRLEVARWLHFRTTDLVAYVGAALQTGDIYAASVVWRRHGRIDRGPDWLNTSSASEAGSVGRSGGNEGIRLAAALPGQLVGIPAAAPPRLLEEWLRDEVLPSLDVAGALVVRGWAENHAREVEALDKLPHRALSFAHAIAEGSCRVLGSAAELMSVHSDELATAEAAAAVGRLRDGMDALHWKPWKRDGLDALGKSLGDLAHAWDTHGLRLPLSKFERLRRDGILFRVLDRVQSPDCLPREISHHVLPMAKRYGLDPDDVLLDYMLICADAIRVSNRARVGAPAAASAGAGGLLTEQRAVAVARCMSAGEGGRSEIRSMAVLALANAASFPFSKGLRELVRDALSWGGPLEEELQDAARALRLSEIVQRYHVTGFSLGDAPRATRLLRHVLAQVHSSSALHDALQVAKAYSHLQERSVYVEFLQNLAVSFPGPAANTPGSTREVGGGKTVTMASSGDYTANRKLAADLATHRWRVTSVLRRLPQADERCVAEEFLLYLLRLLEELEVDAAYTGLKPGQLWGCDFTSKGHFGPGMFSSSGVEGRVTLEPCSEAEEAVLVTAAASAVVGFLREREVQPGGSRRIGTVHKDLAELANDLRRISALQIEYGAFPSLATIQGRGAGGSSGGGAGCWRVLKEMLSELQERLHESQMTAGDRSDKTKQTAAVRGAKKGATPVVRRTDVHKMRALPRLLHRARRLSELLGVAWPRVVSHLANDAASHGRVPEAISLCHTLFRENRDKAATDEKAAALALRDTAVALSTFVASQAHSGALRADGYADAQARAAVLQAMAQSVRGLRQSAALCGREELPLTMDLLQGSEAVAAVLSRCDGGEQLKVLINTMSVASLTPMNSQLSNREERTLAGAASKLDSFDGLYKWYPGDGRVLPLEEALKLVSRFVLQEMCLRRALVGGITHSGATSLDDMSSTEACVLKWEGAMEVATCPLLDFLQSMGAQQLCVRVVALMAVPPPAAVDVLNMSLSGLANKVLNFNHIDCHLAVGYMLALETRQGYEAFRRTIRLSNDDYGRLRTVAQVGMYAARAWANHDLLHQVIEVEQDAHWWHVLTSLGIPFDNRGFTRAERDQVPGEYQRSLVPALLERSGGDLALTVEFCERYGVGEAFPCLLYVEKLIATPCTSPHDTSYQESINKVLPSVYGVFLARLLRRMLENGMIDDRDYERLAFVHGLLLSDKCQSEDEDTEEEKERLEDSLDALEILKGYISPWLVDNEGKPVVSEETSNAALLGVADTKNEDPERPEACSSVAKGVTREGSEDVYSKRLPFRPLVEDPWVVLEPQLRPDSVAMLVPLAEPLRLGVGEFYARLVKGMLKTGGRRGSAASPGRAPVFSALQPWIEKIKSPVLACMTAQTVAAGMTRDADRLEALEVAIKHAVAAGSAQAQLSAPELGGRTAPPVVALLPLMSFERSNGVGARGANEQSGDNGDPDDEYDASEDVVDGLERRTLLLQHLITAKECLGEEMAARLSPHFLASSQELLTKILLFASEQAADRALRLALPAASPTACAAVEDCFSGSCGGGGGMFEFRRQASRALRAARAVADQRGLDPHDVETVLQRLSKGWINQPKACASGSAGGRGVGLGASAGFFVGIGGGSSMGGVETVFVRDAREERMVEDAKLALRAAFVLTKTFSSEDEEGGSVCDSIVYMDLKSRISLLLSIAQDGRDGRVKFRSRLRALLALSALAPPTLVAEVMAAEKEKEGWSEQGEGLKSLSDLRRNIGYMSELEEARLPHKLEELASCPPEDIVRALRRDHRSEHGLIPLLCDMLLDARCTDVSLWSPILADACRYPDLCRVLILRVFPRLTRSPVADAFARSSAALAPSWEEVLKYPLEELKAKEERRRRKAAAAAAVQLGFNGAGFTDSSISSSFGASLYAMSNAGIAGVGKRGTGGVESRSRSTEITNADGTGDVGRTRPEEDDERAVVDQVVLLLRSCPFPGHLDLPWFSSTLADLGPRFHKHAVQAALCISRSHTRTTTVMDIISMFGVTSAVALDELLPEVLAVDEGDGFGGRRLSNKATTDAIFFDIDRRQAYAELDDTRHSKTMAMTLIRVGGVRGLVNSYLKSGNRKDAEAVCTMHYSIRRHDERVATCSTRLINHGTHEGGRLVEEKTDGHCSALERFALEFGLPCCL